IVAAWFLAKCPKFPVRLDSLVVDPVLADSCKGYNKSISPSDLWSPPPLGFFKVNVNGAVNRDWKSSGIGGILRDEKNKVLGSFSISSGPGPPGLAELKAIQTGIGFFMESEWEGKGRLIIESDSAIAVNWIKNTGDCPVLFFQLVRKIVNSVLERNIIIRFVKRGVNWEADRLAKKGIG
ncbi:uncharacterized protein LOC120203908, partial [Hibiscus syriacus]|uniref:uncharacterized protein LOC120203908 n=1 Tax=Hibiscus syriacus TaxID=106335 RepID=UPI00192265FF